MMDVSDGLLIDAARMARASGLAVTVALDRIPLSTEAQGFGGQDRPARLTAATAGDDYELLFALPPLACRRSPRRASAVSLQATA